jgi:hypothetical protein
VEIKLYKTKVSTSFYGCKGAGTLNDYISKAVPWNTAKLEIFVWAYISFIYPVVSFKMMKGLSWDIAYTTVGCLLKEGCPMKIAICY